MKRWNENGIVYQKCDFWSAEEVMETRKHTHTHTDRQACAQKMKSKLTRGDVFPHIAVIQIDNKWYIYGSVKTGSLPWYTTYERQAIFVGRCEWIGPFLEQMRSNFWPRLITRVNNILVPFESWFGWVEQSFRAHLILHGLVLSRQEEGRTCIQYYKPVSTLLMKQNY